jgi:hypothetical protein
LFLIFDEYLIEGIIIRKVFIDSEYRGKEMNVSKSILDTQKGRRCDDPFVLTLCQLSRLDPLHGPLRARARLDLLKSLPAFIIPSVHINIIKEQRVNAISRNA